jgi:hypothetical protein
MSGVGEILACATCVGAPWDKADAGFFWSALLLMAVPAVVAGLIGGWFYYSHATRRAGGPRRSAEALATAPAADKESQA